MTITEMLLWLLLGLVAIVALCFAVLWFEKNFPMTNFDERQQISRGKAYRVGFYVSAIWSIVSLFYIMFGGDIDGMIMIIFLGFSAQALAFHTYCLLTHAALPMSQKPVSTIVSYSILSAFYAVNVCIAKGLDSRWIDKPPVNTLLQLSLAVGFSALAIMHLIQYLRDKKE